MSQKTDFVKLYRANVGQLLAALEQLSKMKEMFDTLDYQTILTDADCQDNEYSITATQFSQAVATIVALDTFIHQYKAELAKLYLVRR